MNGIPSDVREAVLYRDCGRCQRCLKQVDRWPGFSIHHRQGRGGRRPHRLSNLVLLCGSGTTGCHGWAHAHPAEAYESGWMVRRNSADQTDQVPMVDVRGWMFSLTDDGERLAFPWKATA